MSKKNKNEGGTAVLEAPAEKKATKQPAEKKPEPEKKAVTTTQLAEQLGTKPTILRRWLRTLPRFQDNGYTRYGWDEGDPFLADAKASFEKYQKQSEEKKEARLEEARQKGEKKKATKVKKEEEPATQMEESEEEGDFEESDEGEELE